MNNTEQTNSTEQTTNIEENSEVQANEETNNTEEISNTEENSESQANEEQTTNTEENIEIETNEAGETIATTEAQPTENTGMSIPFMGLSILQCIVALLLIIVVLQQSKTASPITSSGSADTNSYWSKNKGRSKEGKLSRLTIILGVIFFIVTLILGFIK